MEINFFKTKLKIILSSLIVAVILFFAITKGINTGQQVAQAESVVTTAQNLASGLQNFYSDQNRFPTVLEFSDKNVMLNYFSSFPPTDFVSSVCSQSFVYKRTAPDSFQLNFCLPVQSGQSVQGWNVINEQPVSM